jgi:hypothetical protein
MLPVTDRLPVCRNASCRSASYENWPALDGLGRKADAISAQIEGSTRNANQAQFERAKIRTVLESEML